ncbi:hypothetical protein HLK66_25005 [Niallia circulans]|uniref:hypothetical protein n=1 Tax=Niallia circulans TaxID=1397 RepID=UPI0014904B59|nr:hypothetical protein [Niallia circulans]QJX64587.1 hypothetical protein HLK66_25005 [Niallia circulans]
MVKTKREMVTASMYIRVGRKPKAPSDPFKQLKDYLIRMGYKNSYRSLVDYEQLSQNSQTLNKSWSLVRENPPIVDIDLWGRVQDMIRRRQIS